ncbi:sensor domain-containing protein [Paenibacillus sp. B2(2019)]|uniref:sensor domain-containing protein n=1 Tax=Paenibacillus sp. B2(2019) TaxID=2607754 RepID=UPI0011F2EC27|nr:sensor domain-containing protein [Paenibacillus sp. B2(2019)]KAA1187160.1 histidine kinase [Paenibacillus sp. B2(2019)]
MSQMIRKHVRNFCFLLITFATGLFYFCFYLVGITFGIAMSFTIVGIPILYYVLRSTETFLQHERIRTKVYTDISVRTLPTRSQEEGNIWEKVKVELFDEHNWRAIIGLMLQLGIGMLSLICATLFYLSPIILLLSPILYFIDISSISLFGIENKTLNTSLLFMLLGAVSLWIGAYLGNSLVKMIGRYTRRLVKDFARR